LRRGDKSLVGNRGYRPFLKLAAGRRFEIDPRRVALDALFDGTYVLRTNTRLTPLQAALRYRDRWMVEDICTAKSLLATRLIFHKYDEPIRGHAFCSFLALVLRNELEDRLAAAGHTSRDRDRAGRQALHPAQRRLRLRRHRAQDPWYRPAAADPLRPAATRPAAMAKSRPAVQVGSNILI
jgi:hypothetical protein